MLPPDQQQLRRVVLQRLQSLHDAGVRGLPRAEPVQRVEAVAPLASQDAGSSSSETEEDRVPRRRPTEPSVAEPATPGSHEAASAKPPMSQEERVAALATLCSDVAACARCKELSSTRSQTVFGVGDPMARLVFLGEAPGADEDRLGEPFVGRAGQLLTNIIEACTLSREDVYILNILKCRPPKNRNPASDETANCRDYLQKQLSIIQPEFICCLGAVAAQNLLETRTSIGDLRGRFHQFGAFRVLATYHPAYLLRNPSAKRATWDDMKLLMSEMGIELPSR